VRALPAADSSFNYSVYCYLGLGLYHLTYLVVTSEHS